MRVRMLHDHEETHTEPGVGALTLRFPAGETHDFNDSAATSLIASKKAEAAPETSARVTMLASVSEREIAKLEQGDTGVTPIDRSANTTYAKGAQWHFSAERAALLISAGLAEADADPTYSPIAATRAEAIARAKAALPAAEVKESPKPKASAAAPASSSVNASTVEG